MNNAMVATERRIQCLVTLVMQYYIFKTNHSTHFVSKLHTSSFSANMLLYGLIFAGVTSKLQI